MNQIQSDYFGGMENFCSNSLEISTKQVLFVNHLTAILTGSIALVSSICFHSPAIAGDIIAASVSIDFDKGCNCLNSASSAIAIGTQNAFAVTTAGESGSSGTAGASAGSLLILGLSANGAAYQYMGPEPSPNRAGATFVGNSIDGNAALTINK